MSEDSGITFKSCKRKNLRARKKSSDEEDDDRQSSEDVL